METERARVRLPAPALLLVAALALAALSADGFLTKTLGAPQASASVGKPRPDRVGRGLDA